MLTETRLNEYPIDKKTGEGPIVWLKVEIDGGHVWLQGIGFTYWMEEENRERLLFEIGGRVVRPLCFAPLEDA